MNSNFTDRAGSRMSVGFAAFTGPNIRHKFDHSLRTAFTAFRLSGSGGKALLRDFHVHRPMRQLQQFLERAPRKFSDRAFGGCFENWRSVKLCGGTKRAISTVSQHPEHHRHGCYP